MIVTIESTFLAISESKEQKYPRRDVRSFVSQLISKKGIEFAGKKLIKFERGLY